MIFALAWPQKPKSDHHTTAPDLDKLTRAVLDALTGVLYLDDKQVIELHARKQYALYPAGPGARITVTEAQSAPHTEADLLASTLEA